jgi:hypothetical protein
MKRAALLVVMMALVLSATAWAQPRFDVIDLGPFLTTTAINRRGTMTGSTWETIEHVMMARGDEVTDLGGRERNVQNFRYGPQDIDNYRFMKDGMHRFFAARLSMCVPYVEVVHGLLMAPQRRQIPS